VTITAAATPAAAFDAIAPTPAETAPPAVTLPAAPPASPAVPATLELPAAAPPPIPSFASDSFFRRMSGPSG
jgi:hypothetical protein